MLWLSRKDIEHISRRLLRDYLKKVPQKVDHIDPADFAEKMCGLQFTFADISEAHDAIGLTATSGVIITIPQRDGTRLDYELDGKTAFIDQSLVAENQIGRLNFTMMHEAAHQLFWMLYPEEYEVQTPRCVFRMADEHTQYPVLDWEEWQTNVLTSYLLLPKELVYRHIQMRKENYGKSPSETIHPLSRKAICGCCGTVLRRKPQRGKYYWCCMRHDTNREECPLMPISETSLCESFCRLYYKLKHQSIPILEQMLTNLQMIRNRRMLWSPDIVALNKRISDLSSQNQTLAFLKQQGLVDPDIFIAKTNELTKQLRQVKLEKEKLMDAESDMTALQTRDLIDLLEGGPEFLDSFDAELFGELVEKIIIESNDSVRFCLKNGLELRESIERTVR